MVSDTPSCIRFMGSTDSSLPWAVRSVADVLHRPVHWTTALPATLRRIGVADLLSPCGLDFESYGTLRMMARSANAARRITGSVDSPDAAESSVILLERLPSPVVAELDAAGLSLVEVDDSAIVAGIGALRQAWRLVHDVWRELSSSIAYLVRCVHLLEAPSRELDCSYSRPDLPFSVFLSVPDHGTRGRIERVMEALVHETMHLQLSLVERRIQLMESDRAETMAFSPWRDSERNVQGVLHALHVFVVVQSLWKRAARRAPRGIDRDFAEARVRDIRDEVARARRLVASPGLSREGRELVRRLLELGSTGE